MLTVRQLYDAGHKVDRLAQKLRLRPNSNFQFHFSVFTEKTKKLKKTKNVLIAGVQSLN